MLTVTTSKLPYVWVNGKMNTLNLITFNTYAHLSEHAN